MIDWRGGSKGHSKNRRIDRNLYCSKKELRKQQFNVTFKKTRNCIEC